jgi:predicted ATPase
MKNKWIVLAGGPNSGKTTTLAELKAQGYTVEPEQATKIIHEYIEQGIPLESLHNDPAAGAKFQEEIARRQIETEESHQKDEVVFFDRGAFDYLVFSRLRGLPLNDDILQAVRERTYGTVFVLNLIESEFKQTKIEAHLDDPVQAAKEQEKLLLSVLDELDIPYVHVPVMPIKDRVDFILERVG